MPLTPTHTAALTAAAQHRTETERAARRAQAAFAEVVAWACGQQGVTENDVAELLGVSQQRVSQVRAAGRALSNDRLY